LKLLSDPYEGRDTETSKTGELQFGHSTRQFSTGERIMEIKRKGHTARETRLEDKSAIQSNRRSRTRIRQGTKTTSATRNQQTQTVFQLETVFRLE
jgi:hypothetical protein